MDNPPLFDHPELFDPKRLLLADIDGSGTTDLIYLHGEGGRLTFNQSGNSWSPVATLPAFAPIHNGAQVTTLDLLGNGTACLLWSSPLPGDGGRQMRYLPLMAEGKPHLLIHSRNNLGAETTIRYAPSSLFALEDALAGRPWITKLPFPVQVVESVSVSDRWRGSRFTSSYSYHHGYFDGHEREFRGFGRVEQTDVEEFGSFAAGNAASPYITADLTLYQPPVKTITWFH
ncbi:MAG: toxin TcdB middle/N-terminal domain-containing protein, partial [Cyanobacteriota bacterium]